MPPLRLPGLLPTLSLTLASLFPITLCMCYVSNGSAVLNWGPNSVYQPCSNDSSNPLSTICCAINRSNPSGGNVANGFTQDICLPSGLCKNILVDANGDTVYAYWRDYCTVIDYTSSKCLDVCTGNGVCHGNFQSRYASTFQQYLYTTPKTHCGYSRTASKETRPSTYPGIFTNNPR